MAQMTDNRLTNQLKRWQSLDDLLRYFSTETRCREFLFRILYPDGLRCPKCGGIVIYRRHGDRAAGLRYKSGRTYRRPKGHSGPCYHCEECNHNFSVTVNTIFHSTKLPLRKWFAAIWLMVNNRKGCNSCMLSRELGITQTTAWHMLHKIRRTMVQDESPLRGTVQVDAAYVGGQLRWVASSRRKVSSLSAQGQDSAVRTPYLRNKVSVLGLIGDKLTMKVIPEGSWSNIRPILINHLDRDAIVHSDSGKEFMRIGQELRLLHLVCDHSKGQFVNDGVSTNRIEGAWSHLKRQAKGVYHLMPKKHAQRYIDEFVWRWNARELNAPDRAAAYFPNIRIKITWKDLEQPI